MKKLLSVIVAFIVTCTTILPAVAATKEQEEMNLVDGLLLSKEVELISMESSNDIIQYQYEICDTIETAIVEKVKNGTKYIFEDINVGKKDEILITLDGDLYLDGSLVKIEEIATDESSTDVLGIVRAGLVDEEWYFADSPYVDGAYNSNVKTKYESLTFKRAIAALTISVVSAVIAVVLAGVSAGSTMLGFATLGAGMIITWYENNNPNSKQCWMKYIRSSNERIDSGFDSTTYYHVFNNYYYGDIDRSQLVGNNYSYAKQILTY